MALASHLLKSPVTFDHPQMNSSAREHEKNFTSRCGKFFWTVLAPFDPLIGFLITQPLADALALKTYTHGTNFLNYLEIRCHGADPLKGGQMNGCRAAFETNDPLEELKHCRGYFHLFKDIDDISDKMVYEKNTNGKNTQIVQFIHGTRVSAPKSTENNSVEELHYVNGKLVENGETTNLPQYTCRPHRLGQGETIFPAGPNKEETWAITATRPDSSDKYYVRSLLPTRHAIVSGIGLFTDLTETGKFSTLKRVLGAISGALTPTVSIRIDDRDPLAKHLEVDPYCPHLAVKTRQFIPTNYIGLTGIINQGINRNAFQRIKQRPIKALLGVARLVALGAIIYGLYMSILLV